METTNKSNANGSKIDSAVKIFGAAKNSLPPTSSRQNIPVRLLIVDDMSTMRSVIRNGIKQTFHNAEIEEAVNGTEAQRKLEKNSFDLIISDWEMPHMSRLDLLKWVRAHPNLKNIPFIMVTANHHKNLVQESIHLGVNAFLLKPFTIDALTTKMASLIDKLNKREFERYNANFPIKIISPIDSKETIGELIDISYGGLFASIPRADYRPYVLDDARIEITYQRGDGENKVVSLTGFVS